MIIILKQILHFSESLFLLGEEPNYPGFLFLGKTKGFGGACVFIYVCGEGGSLHLLLSEACQLLLAPHLLCIKSQVFKMMKPNLSLGRSDSGLSMERSLLWGLGSSTAVWVSPTVAMVSLQTSKAGDSWKHSPFWLQAFSTCFFFHCVTSESSELSFTFLLGNFSLLLVKIWRLCASHSLFRLKINCSSFKMRLYFFIESEAIETHSWMLPFCHSSYHSMCCMRFNIVSRI